MSVDFNEILSPDQRVAILENSIQQFAAEGYRHELNKRVGFEKGDERLVEDSQLAIDTITAAIITYRQELEGIVH